MKLQKIFRSNSGFSMVEISVAMGLLGLASLAVMNLSDQVSNSTRKAETMLSKSQFASALGGYMYSGSACDELKGMPAFTQAPSEIVLNDWKIAGFNDGELMKQIGSGKKFKNFKLKSLTGSMPDPATMPKVRVGTVDWTKTFLNIRAEVEVKLNTKLHEDDPAGKKSYEYFFNVPVLADATGKVGFCNEEKTIQETCVAMKGEYVDGKCELQKTCNVQGTYAQLICTPSGQACSTSGGRNTNNPISGGIYGMGCPPIPDMSAIVTGTKTWSHIGTCSGKKCSPPTVTNTLTYYACLQCPGLGTPTTGGGGGGPTGGGGGGGGGGGCFVAGTQITMFGGERKNIEDVVIGDSLVDHKGMEVKVQVLRRYAHNGKVYSINGGPFFFTDNHPFLTTEGFKSLDPKKTMQESPGLVVGKLKVGDTLLKINGAEVLKSLDAKEFNDTVYNFTLSGSHEYIADDYAVHNKL